jgi:hypothetical protein
MSKNLPEFKKDSLYGYIQYYEYYIPPISAISIGALAGFKIGGIYGAAISGMFGGIFGIADKMLIHYDIISNHYLTCAILGTGMMNSLGIPHYIGEAIGFSIGLLTPTGYVNSLRVAMPTIVTTIITTQYAQKKFPKSEHNIAYGASSGVIIALTDETLIGLNITEKHYLNYCYEL